ncbi:MAG: hypothetical protein QOG10_3540 [Kribbellaceae bacterium]|nr:hypothetical protein [Kribbellaceae bacterium]
MDAQQVSKLTARWLGKLSGEGSTVLSGLGVWPLLAILGELADGPARAELQAAAGGSNDGGLDVFTGTTDVHAALALWTRPEVPLAAGVDSILPAELRGVLSNQAALDDWVTTQTGGLLKRMPVELRPDTLLVLSSALAVRTTWRLRFHEYPRRLNSSEVPYRWLSRQDADLDSLRCYKTPTAGPLTVATVAGTGDVDVLLVAGEPDRSRTVVLSAALTSLDGSSISSQELLTGQVAPAVTVIDSMSPIPQVVLSMPYFEVDAEHDLLQQAEALGLVSASDTTRGHFPGLSPMPLAVGQAKQAVMARFSATGFEAAAVTAVAAAPGSAPQTSGKALLVDLTRPFGFLAIHRPTGILVVLGWVTGDAFSPSPELSRAW